MIIKISYEKNYDLIFEDLLGNIVMESTDGKIEEIDTYLDDWLDALIDMYQFFIQRKDIEIDLLDEPELLKGKIKNESYFIEYGNQSLSFKNLEKFALEIKSASVDISNDYKLSQYCGKNGMLKKIYNFSVSK